MMGYSLGVESNKPKGATFFIDIKIDEKNHFKLPEYFYFPAILFPLLHQQYSKNYQTGKS